MRQGLLEKRAYQRMIRNCIEARRRDLRKEMVTIPIRTALRKRPCVCRGGVDTASESIASGVFAIGTHRDISESIFESLGRIGIHPSRA
jgi:hypothetical protein